MAKTPMLSAPLRRRTLAEVVRLVGPSLATGRDVTVTLRPAERPTGLVFRHLPTGTDIPADLAHVADVPHCTSLHAGAARIDFAEHLLAALSASGVTDVTIEVDGGEAPLLDGSAAPYARALAHAGTRELPEALRPIVLDTVFHHLRDAAAIVAYPGEAELCYLLDHEHPLIGRQWASYRPSIDDFAAALAPARTFATEQEARTLLTARGLQGGSEAMAIIAYADRLSAPQPLPDSFARHKVVDLLGDLYLLGRPVIGRIVACRTGHADNRALARMIAEACL